jgi:hypothetical protein
VPNNIGFVLKSPVLHDAKAIGKESVGHPQIKVSSVLSHCSDGKLTNLICGKRCVAGEAKMLRSHLPGPVDESPGGVYENCTKFIACGFGQKLFTGSLNIH